MGPPAPDHWNMGGFVIVYVTAVCVSVVVPEVLSPVIPENVEGIIWASTRENLSSASFKQVSSATETS